MSHGEPQETLRRATPRILARRQRLGVRRRLEPRARKLTYNMQLAPLHLGGNLPMKWNSIGWTGLLVLVLATPALGQWRGEETVREGVVYVSNPEQPMDEVTLELEELWRRGGDDDEVLFGVVGQLVEDGDRNVYLLDSQLSEIQVFSPDGEYLRTVGREGEGPGEFRNGSDMFLAPGNLLSVVQIFPGKVVQLTTDGDPAGNYKIPENTGGGFQLVHIGRSNGERIVLAYAQSRAADGSGQQSRKQIQTTYLRAFDAEGNELARFHEESNETVFGGMKFVESTFSDFARRWALSKDGRVAAALSFDDYRIHVWNPDGSVNRIIERPDFEPVQRDAAAKKRFQKFFESITRWNRGSTFEVSETHSATQGLWFRNDGSLWVMSAAGAWGREDGILASIDVYDDEGRYVQRIKLVAEGDPAEDGLFFLGDRMYRVTDLLSAAMASMGGGTEADVAEDVEPVSVVAYRMQGPAIGMK
jgi:hypothetical protein